MFDDDTGEALNPAARKLVQEALAADELALEANGGAAPELGPILASIPVVDCAEGTHKYVQVQLSHPDEPGTQRLVVRSYATCRYHAENYMKLMRILRADERTRGVVGRVIGRRPNTIRPGGVAAVVRGVRLFQNVRTRRGVQRKDRGDRSSQLPGIRGREVVR